MKCRFRSVETFESGSVFATRTSRFNKTQGALSRLRGALQLAPRFLSCLSVVHTYTIGSCNRLDCHAGGRSQRVGHM